MNTQQEISKAILFAVADVESEVAEDIIIGATMVATRNANQFATRNAIHNAVIYSITIRGIKQF